MLCFAARLQANDYLCSNITVIDGDTIVADIYLGYGVTLKQAKIRFSNYDAWETSLSRKTIEFVPDELERGKKAKAYLESLLKVENTKLYLTSSKEEKDVYGRLLGIPFLMLGEKRYNLKDLMDKNHHIRTKSVLIPNEK